MVSTLQTEHLKENVGDAIALATQQEIVENLKTTREKCGKIGHFPACWHTRQSQGGATVGGKAHRGRGGMDRNSGRGRGKQNVRSIEKRDTAVEESDTFYVFSVNPSAYVMPINIEEKSVSMIIYSGSRCNILPEATFRKMPGLKLRSCNSRVYAYTSRSPLEVMGSCEVSIRRWRSRCCTFVGGQRRPCCSVRKKDSRRARSAQSRAGSRRVFYRRVNQG